MTTTRTSDQPKKPPKARKCRICRQAYRPWRDMQPTCGDQECEHAYAMQVVAKRQAKRAAEERKAQRLADQARKDKLTKLHVFKKRTEKACNAVVRYRDREDGCISCGTHDADEWHAGHWIPVGRSEAVRYDLRQINKQCRQCNFFGAGMATAYEERLVAKIGRDEVEKVRAASRIEKRWTRDELKALEADFKAQLRELKKRQS